MKVILRDISQNKGPVFHNLVPFQIYGCLYEAESGRLIVSATIGYIETAIRERKYDLVSVEGVEVH